MLKRGSLVAYGISDCKTIVLNLHIVGTGGGGGEAAGAAAPNNKVGGR